MTIPLSFRLSAIGAFFMVAAVVCFAQAPAAQAVHGPDLLGIYTGMPAAAARAQLQKRSSTINVTTNNVNDGFDLLIPDPMNREVINVFLTAPPNEPTVWMVARSQNFSPQNPMSRNALLDALHEKYGKETFTNDRGGGGLYVYWIYDGNGKLLPSADMGLTGCNSAFYRRYVQSGLPPSPTPIEQTCFKSFFAVTAMLNLRDAQLLESYNVELVNLPLAYKAAAATADESNAAAGQARKDQINRADTNKPKF